MVPGQSIMMVMVILSTRAPLLRSDAAVPSLLVVEIEDIVYARGPMIELMDAGRRGVSSREAPPLLW